MQINGASYSVNHSLTPPSRISNEALKKQIIQSLIYHLPNLPAADGDWNSGESLARCQYHAVDIPKQEAWGWEVHQALEKLSLENLKKINHFFLVLFRPNMENHNRYDIINNLKKVSDDEWKDIAQQANVLAISNISNDHDVAWAISILTSIPTTHKRAKIVEEALKKCKWNMNGLERVKILKGVFDQYCYKPIN